MAKKKKTCARKTIVIKKKKTGKILATFTGRPGGSASCGKIRRKRTPQMAVIAKAGRSCKKSGRPGTKKNVACIRAFFR